MTPEGSLCWYRLCVQAFGVQGSRHSLPAGTAVGFFVPPEQVLEVQDRLVDILPRVPSIEGYGLCLFLVALIAREEVGVFLDCSVF